MANRDPTYVRNLVLEEYRLAEVIDGLKMNMQRLAALVDSVGFSGDVLLQIINLQVLSTFW